MARFTVYMPDAVHRRAVEADLNLSQLLTEAATARLAEREGCGHTTCACIGCGARIEHPSDDA